MTNQRGNESLDFWYAVNNTEVVLMPSAKLETFGTTILNYHLISELMDSVNQVRVREGQIRAARPQIMTPAAYAHSLLEGFGEEARRYVDWVLEHERELHMLQYGFSLRKQEFSEEILTDNLRTVAERVKERVKDRNDPLGSVVIGVDKPWEVCLIKLMFDVIRESAPGHFAEMDRRRLFEPADGLPRGVRQDIEAHFRAASRDKALIKSLARKLQLHGVFETFEDRFFALVRSHKG